MSTVENLGNTKTIRIGEASDQEVDNYSRKIAIIHNGGTIPLLGKEGSHEETGRHEIAGANQHTAIDAEVYEDEIYLLSRAPVAKYYTVNKYDLTTGREEASWDSGSFDWTTNNGARTTPYTNDWTGYEGYKQAFIKFREEFSFLSIPSHNTGKISGSSGTSESASSGEDIVEISSPTKFKVKNIDKITNFNPSTDTLEIDTKSFGIDSSATFAAGKNKKAIKNKLAKQDFDFLYDQKKGGLYFNENGADKGFGDGGIIAILKGAPDLTSDNLKFINSTIYAPKKFNKKSADKITNFNPSTDTLEIDTDSFGIDSSATFASGKNKKVFKKKLAKQDFDFLYDKKKGGLYFNENGADKGFGDGGIIAILKGAPDLTGSNLEFI